MSRRTVLKPTSAFNRDGTSAASFPTQAITWDCIFDKNSEIKWTIDNRFSGDALATTLSWCQTELKYSGTTCKKSKQKLP